MLLEIMCNHRALINPWTTFNVLQGWYWLQFNKALCVCQSYNIVRSKRSMLIKWWKQRWEVSSVRMYTTFGTEKQIYLLFSYKTEQEIEDSLALYTALLISGWLLILKAGCGFRILKIYCKKDMALLSLDKIQDNLAKDCWCLTETSNKKSIKHSMSIKRWQLKRIELKLRFKERVLCLYSHIIHNDEEIL